MSKRIFSFFLSVVMVLSMMPPLTLSANAEIIGSVVYNRQKLERPVLTLGMSQDSGFLEDAATKSSFFSHGWLFNSADGGLYSRTYKRYRAVHTFTFGSDYGVKMITQMKERNQLWVGYTLSMCPDRHGNIAHPVTEKLCYQYTGMYDDKDRYYFRYSGGDNTRNSLKNYGSAIDFQKVDSEASFLDVQFGLSGSCTSHGDAYVTDATLYFADRQSPRIAQIVTTADMDGKVPKQYFKEDESVYIHLEYDEPIRFSDNSPNHDNITLALNVGRKASASDAGVEAQYAKLIALNDHRLTFQYKVPVTINNSATGAEATDHYIIGIKGSSDQPSFYGDDTAFDLIYCYGSTDRSALPEKYKNNPDYVKTSSLVTDLAGNPAQSFTPKALVNYTYLDTVDPKIAYVSVEGSMIDANYTGDLDSPELDRSSVFTGVGDSLTFTAWFSEYMVIAPAHYKDIVATLNVKDAGGNPVKLKAVKSGNAKRNVEDKFDSTYITFEPMTVTAGMTPVEYSSVEDKSISIESVGLLDGVILTDPSSNAYSPVANIIKELKITANKKEFLDNLAPGAFTSAEVSEGKYRPILYSVPDTSRFCFPITPKDNTGSSGPAYVSGISTKVDRGMFMWQSSVPFTFRYLVSASSEKPAASDDKWKTGYANTKYSFTQVSLGNFIHIDLPDEAEYNIMDTSFILYPEDFAGNVGEQTFPLDYIYDSKGPVITPVSYETGAGTGSDNGYIRATVKLEDLSKVDAAKVYYYWDDQSISSDDTPDWKQYGGISESAASMDLIFTLDGLANGVKHDYKLFIKSNDQSAAISGGNQTISDGFQYRMDLSYPAYDFSYSTGYEVEPQLIINNLQKHPDTGNDSTVIVMIKDPGGETGNEYFVRTITTGNEAFKNPMADGDVMDHFVFDELGKQPMSEPNLWRYHTVITDSTSGDAILFNDDGPTLKKLLYSSTDKQDIAKRLQAIMGGKYYGEIEVTLISGYGAVGHSSGVLVESGAQYQKIKEAYPDASEIKSFSAGSANFTGLDCYVVKVGDAYICLALDRDGNLLDTDKIVRTYIDPNDIFIPSTHSNYISAIPGDANADVKTYTLKVASQDKATGAGYATESRTIHTIGLSRNSDSSVTLPWESNPVPTSLEGEEWTVTINNGVMPSWNLKDVDFTSENTFMGIYLIDSPDTGAPVNSEVPVWKARLSALSTQTVKVPAGVTLYSGLYQVKVQVSAKSSGKIDSGYMDRVVDRTSLTDFGPKGAEHSYQYEGALSLTEEFNYSLVTPRLYLGRQTGKEVTLFFGTEEGALSDGTNSYRKQYIRVWNATGGVNEAQTMANATWYDISTGSFEKGYSVRFFNDALGVESATGAVLGLLPNRENIVRYQLAGANGKVSAVRTLAIEASDELPTLEMGLTPESSTVSLRSATAFIKKLESATMTEMTAKTVEAVPQVVASIGHAITDSSTHAFYTTNVYGNFAFDKVRASFIDSTAPTTQSFTFAGDMNNKNNLGLYFYDNMPTDPSKTKFFIKFEADYMERLQKLSGFEVNPDGFIPITLPSIPAGQRYAEWTCGENTAPGGIYKVGVNNDTARDNYGGLPIQHSVFIYMDYLYDATKPQNFSMNASYYMEDEAGNRSAVGSTNINVNNQPPKVTEANNTAQYSGNLMDIDLTFNRPLKVISPDVGTHTNFDSRYENPSRGYALKREAMPVFEAGDHTLTVSDIFGVEYPVSYTLDPVLFGDFGLDVQFSTTAQTRENITVNIKVQTPGTTFRVIQMPENSEIDYSQSIDRESALIKLSENGFIILFVNNSEVRQVAIPVTNILKAAPDVVETWYYSELSSNTLPKGITETTQKVTVFISSAIEDRQIEGADGSSLSYTFPFGTKAGDTHTFTYTDSTGNIGTKTVKCPVSITQPNLPDEDKEAPNFTVKVYGKYGGVYKHNESWYSPETTTPLDANGNPLPSVTTPVTNTGTDDAGNLVIYSSFKDLLDNMSWTGGYKLVFDVFDQNPAKLVLLNPSDSVTGLTYANADQYQRTIEGVTLSDHTVTITNKDAFFKIAVVDDGNEHQLVGETYQSKPYSSIKEMTFGGPDHWWIDTQAPTAQTAQEFTNFYTKTIFFKLEDDKSGVVPISPIWPLLTDSTSPFYAQYKDWYYKEVTDSMPITIDFRDGAYNQSRTTIEVTGLDDSNPKATLEWWSPSAYSEDPSTGAIVREAPNYLTNRTVRAGISFDRNIMDMKLWRWDGAAFTDDPTLVAPYATLEKQADFAIINFLQGARVKLTFEAQNTKTGEIELTLADVIDKTPPVVKIVETKNDTVKSTKATFVFSISEDVVDGMGTLYQAIDGQFEKEITARGTYDFIFTDEAGNSVKVTGTVSHIDEASPVILFDMPDENTSVSGSYTFKAAMNEAGTMTMLDQTKIVATPTDYDTNGKPKASALIWHDFTVTRNGSYLVTGTDAAGRTSSYYVSVDCIDNIPPNINISTSTLRVRQQTDVATLTDQMLLSGVTLTDNVTSSADLVIQLSGKPTQMDLNTPGVYTITIRVTDKAGNTKEAQRFIRVYSKNEPEVLVNGIKTDHMGTTVILGTYELELLVNIPDFGNEPYIVYIKKGDKTAGQMKRDAQVITGSRYTVTENGYYTLYIVRQNREVYLTKLYIER